MSDDPVQWLDSLPEPLRDAPYFKPPEDGSHRTVEQVVADLANAAQMQGNLKDTHLKIPSPEAAAEDIAAFRERVLQVDPQLIAKPEDYSPVPANADGYETPQLDGFDQDLTPVKEMALANKWSQAQYGAYVQHLATQAGAQSEATNNWKQEQANKLNEALGAARADHLARTISAVQGEFPDLAQKIQLGEVDAHLVLALDRLVHQMVDMGGEVAGEFNSMAGAGARQLTPSEAQAKLDEIRDKLVNGRPPGPERARLQAQLLEYTKLSRPH